MAEIVIDNTILASVKGKVVVITGMSIFGHISISHSIVLGGHPLSVRQSSTASFLGYRGRTMFII